MGLNSCSKIACLVLLVSFSCAGQAPNLERDRTRLLSLFDRDRFFNRQKDLLLFYVFAASNSGYVVVKNQHHYETYQIKIMERGLSKRLVADSLTENLVSRISKRNLETISFRAFSCKEPTYVPHDFFMMLLVRSRGKVIDQSQISYGCINAQRRHPQYNFYISFFALLLNIGLLEDHIALPPNWRNEVPRE